MLVAEWVASGLEILETDEPGGELNLAWTAQACDAGSEQGHSGGMDRVCGVTEEADGAGSEVQVARAADVEDVHEEVKVVAFAF